VAKLPAPPSLPGLPVVKGELPVAPAVTRLPAAPALPVSAATGSDAVDAALTTPLAPPVPSTMAPSSAPSVTAPGGAAAPSGVTAQHHSVGLPPSWILPAGFAPASPDAASSLPLTVPQPATDAASRGSAPVAPGAPSAPFGAGASGAFAASGFGSGLVAVLLFALGWLAVQRLFRVVLVPARSGSVAFCWLLERPG
jgi:hypothetical protein